LSTAKAKSGEKRSGAIPAILAKPADAPKSVSSNPTSSGVKLVAMRVADFRSLKNIEIAYNELTVLVGANNAGKTSLLDAMQFAIGATRRLVGREDIRLDNDEADVPKERRALVDILLRPTDNNGKIVESFPEGSFWTGLWGTGIAQDDTQDDMVGIRSILEWSDLHGEYRTTRKFLKEWKPFAQWQDAEDGDPVRATQIEPLALHYIDAKRDLDEDLRTRGSFWRRLTDDLGLSEGDIQKLEDALSDINKTLVDKSEVLKHLRDNLMELKKIISFEKAGIEIAPVPRHLRDLSRGVDVTLNSGGASAFPLTRHGMGTRSLASLLVFRAYALWRHERAEEGGDEVHTLLALEEPEAHLHPHAQRALFAQIHDMPGQRIVSTHSPYFVAQSRLEDLRLLVKTKSDTSVSQLDVSKLTSNDRRKLVREVLATRGDLLFSRALILFEGETEEQALPIFAECYLGTSTHEKGFSFVGCGGANYFPFVWLAHSFGISWYILCDGEDKTIMSVNRQLKKIELPNVDKLDNISVIDGEKDYEGHLIAMGYMDAVEVAFTAAMGTGYFNQYIEDQHGKPGKKIDGKTSTRDYKSIGGRERAAYDLLKERRTSLSKPVATAIVELEDETRRVPPAIRKLFDKISADLKED
jgi:putative ATP-dependent endonuclease of the OLD family